MNPLTASQMALANFFYTITDDPRVKAAGRDPWKFGRAILDRATDDVEAVTLFVLGVKVVPKITEGAGNVLRTALGGTVSEATRREIAGGVESLMGGGLRHGLEWLGKRLVEEKAKKKDGK
jgi:hypothetical protein